jgi:hypothetical protein
MSEVIEMPRAQAVAVAPSTPADLLRIAVEGGADLDKLERLMALQERWEAQQAKKLYDQAFAAFKAEAVKIIKGRNVTDGPLKGKSYAELHDVVNAVTPALSRHGLSSSWKLTKDERDWMEVTCYVRHVGGHQESVSMGGPPDTGGAKNAIQARASTKTYLERYTLKAITGLSEQNDDTDGNAPGSDALLDWVAKVDESLTEEDLRATSKAGAKYFQVTKDKPGYAKFAAAVQARGAVLKQGVSHG